MYIYLKSKKDTVRPIPLFVCSPNVCHSWDWSRVEPGLRIPSWPSPRHLGHHLLPVRMHKSRAEIKSMHSNNECACPKLSPNNGAECLSCFLRVGAEAC